MAVGVIFFKNWKTLVKRMIKKDLPLVFLLVIKFDYLAIVNRIKVDANEQIFYFT